jgi:hypothetical protein
MSDQQDEPKIVVDDDWKRKVQAEREAAEAAKRSPDQPQAGPQKPTRERPAGDVPPASFSFLASTLAAQAMTAMGQAPDPVTGHAVVRPDLAQHYIDTLDMLEAKTKGNLTAPEAAVLSTILYQLRMLYVAVRAQPPEEQKAAPQAE